MIDKNGMILVEAQPQGLVAFNGAHALRETLQRVELVANVLEHVMKDGTHYGEGFPGDKKKNLLKAGADTLGVAFQMAPEFDVVIHELGGDHRECRVTCTIKSQQSGMTIGQGVGSCSTKETKYRWRNAAIKCPECGAEAVMKGKPEYAPKENGVVDPAYKEGGWLCWKNNKKTPGCGMTWGDTDPAIVNQPRGKVENTDPADQWNTVLKMAKKRAFVDGMITATGCSDMFTQDLEDIDASLKTTATATNRPASGAEKAPSQAQEAPKAAEAPKVQETPPMAQNAQEGAKEQVEDQIPSEEYLLTMLKGAGTEAQVLEAWGLALKFQANLGGGVVKRVRDLFNKRLDEVKKGA